MSGWVRVATALAVLGWIGLSGVTFLPSDRRHSEREVSSSIASSVDLVDVTSEGRRVRVQVGEIERRSGQRGVIRSPLLAGTVMHDLRIWVGGELLVDEDQLMIPKLGASGSEFEIAGIDELIASVLEAVE